MLVVCNAFLTDILPVLLSFSSSWVCLFVQLVVPLIHSGPVSHFDSHQNLVILASRLLLHVGAFSSSILDFIPRCF